MDRCFHFDGYRQSIPAEANQLAGTVHYGVRRIAWSRQFLAGGDARTERRPTATDVRYHHAGCHPVHRLRTGECVPVLPISRFRLPASLLHATLPRTVLYQLLQGGTIKLFVRLLDIKKDSKAARHLTHEINETVRLLFLTIH